MTGRPKIRRAPTEVRTIPIGERAISTSSLSEEIQDYVDVLLGRTVPPENFGELTLAELASAYYGRAKEIEMYILRAEREGVVKRGQPYYKFRTGELRSFIELAANAFEMGSRRMSAAKMQAEMEARGM